MADRQTDGRTYRQISRQTQSKRQRNINKRSVRQTDQYTVSQADRSIHGQPGRQINTRSARQTDQYTVSQADRSIHGQSGRKTDRQTDKTQTGHPSESSYFSFVATHVNQHVHKSLKAGRLTCVSKLRLSVVHDVFPGPLWNLLSAQHQLQLVWSERTKFLHWKHGVKPVCKIKFIKSYVPSFLRYFHTRRFWYYCSRMNLALK